MVIFRVLDIVGPLVGLFLDYVLDIVVYVIQSESLGGSTLDVT